MLAAVARGRTVIVNPNRGRDVAATIRALRQLGVRVRRTDDGYEVTGRESLRSPFATIDCANSGTTMRLLLGLLAGRVDAVLDGDASLRRRPMARVIGPLNAMGARITTARPGLAPLRVRRNAERLKPVSHTMAVASAQLKSALILAALRASAPSTIVEPWPTRDHTERMVVAMGGGLTRKGHTIRVRPSSLTSCGRVLIPGDISSAFYLICAAAAMPAVSLRLRDVSINPTRTAALDVVRRMGARLRITRRRIWSGEPVADISIEGGAPLCNVTIAPGLVPILIDEIPALCALACVARGVFTVRGAAELREKESDRIQTTVGLLQSFGADARALEDGISVRGGRTLRAPRSVSTCGDHRIGLAAAVLAAATGSSLTIRDSSCISTSFPGFSAIWRAALRKRRSFASSR